MSRKPIGGEPSRIHRLCAALAYVVVGVLTTSILAEAKSVIGHSTWGREAEMWAFGLLQGSLSSFDPENPVVLLDVSNLPEDGSVLTNKMREIVGTLKTLDRRPIAVAVDIDYSQSGVMSDQVSKFFDACLKREKDDVPIYLAVGQNKSAPAEVRLGLDKYKELAGAVAINPDDTRRIPIWVQASDQTEKFKTINYLLALEYRRQLPEPPSLINWAVDRSEEGGAYTHERTEAENDQIVLNYGERLVNYSKLDTMKVAARKDTDEQSIRNNSASYSGKLVIVGDVATPKDFFPVPLRQHDQAGSLLLACATYTLVKEPLFTFKSRVSTALDFFIAGFIIAMVAIIRYRNPNNLSWIGKQALFIYISILVIVIGGFLLVRLAGIMWLDFLLVAFAFLLHPKVERVLHRILRKLKICGVSDRQSEATAPVLKILCLLAILIMAASASAQQQPADLCQAKVAAIALRFKKDPAPKRDKRTCHFRANENVIWQELSESDMLKKSFQAGEDLRCDKGCILVIYLCGIEKEYPVTKNEPEWERLTNPWRIPRRIKDPNQGIPAKTPTWPRPPNPSTSSGRRFFYDGAATAGTADPRGTYGKLGDYDPALMKRSDTERNRSVTFAALLNEGNALRDAKKYAEAEHAYMRALQLIPDSRPFFGLGNVYADQEKWKEAEDAYQYAISIGTNSAEVYVALALILLNQPPGEVSADRLAQAETYLHKAAITQPTNDVAYEHLYSLMTKRTASPAEFELLYRRVLKVNPKSFITNLRLSLWLRRNGQSREASGYLRVAAKAASDSPELLAVAEAFESEGQYRKAEKFVRLALRLNPNDPRGHLILGLVLIDRSQYAEAVEQLQNAVEKTPDDFVSRHLLGVAQLGNRNLNEAERNFIEAASKISPGKEQLFATAHWLGLLGDALSAEGRSRDAERVYKKALDYDPSDLEIKQKLSEIRMRP